MKTCAIVGANWGDEGKGRMIDLVSEDFDIVIRYQGGANAGHTVINEFGEFKLNLIPSGIFRPEVVNILGNGVVVDLEHLCGEIDKLEKAGIRITPDNLKISDRAAIVFPYHILLDGLEEARLKDAKYGSTKRGIAPVYSDKYQKKCIQMGELLLPEYLDKRVKSILEWKNLTITGVYGEQPVSLESVMEYLNTYGKRLAPFVTDTGAFIRRSYGEGKKVLFEAQLGALRDIELGIYPYTSSSSPLSAYAPLGAGVPDIKIDETVAVVKAYSTCVGEGPFTAEWFGEEAHALREAGHEYGAATGRPRRVGPFDLVATNYGLTLQGATKVALTKLDTISYMERIPVCVAYEIDGKRVENFPMTPYLANAKPVIEYLPGWQEDISGVRYFDQLPENAKKYVLYLEQQLGVPFAYVSVGAERDAIIYR